MHPLEAMFYVTTKIAVPGPYGLEVLATGFLFKYNVEEGFCLWLVTNKHVVERVRERGLTAVVVAFHDKEIGEAGRVRPKKEETQIELGDFTKKAILHEDEDLAVYEMPWDLIEPLFANMVSTDIIPTDEAWALLNPLEDLIFIGYPDGLHDTFNNLPIRRTGVTSTPIQVNYKGKEQILIEAAIFPGSSGSPVFLNKPSMSSDQDGIPVIGPRLFFIGVISEYLQTVGAKKENLHLGIVVKHSALTALVKTDVGRDFYRKPKKEVANG